MAVSNFKAIDMNTWKRATNYSFFRHAANSNYLTGLNLDITNFLAKVKERKLPFYYSLVHAVTLCANQVEELRYRIINGEVILYDAISPSFTVMQEDSDLFKVVTIDWITDLMEFSKAAEEKTESQKEFIEGPKREDVFHISCIPWISFTYITHTESGDKDDAIPKISWGKYFKDGDRILLPFSIQVNHCFADGYHVGKYVNALQDYLNNFR